jgi:DNA-3-methyladenine glycosylase II
MEKAIKHLLKDKVLKQIIETTGEYQRSFDAGKDVYLSLLESIVSQQISTKAADSIFKKFLSLFENNIPEANLLLSKTDEELRNVGLSFQKIKYLKSVATFSLSNDLSFDYLQKLDDEEVVQYLLPISGVGRWTVEMLMMFVLKREDIFPFDDLVIKQKIVKAYNLQETGKELKKKAFEIAENWKPYRTIASQYLWTWKAGL